MKQGALEQLGGKVAEWRWAAWRWAAWTAQLRPPDLCHSMYEPERRPSHSASGYLGPWHLALACLSSPFLHPKEA